MSRIPLPRLPRRLRLPSGLPLPPSPPLPPRPPLPLTAAAISLLVALPLLALWRLPRPQAEGLEKLLSAASLLQSFDPSPDRPVPALWQERLGTPLATALWRRQSRTWWQFWGIHSDVPPYLALPAVGPLSGPPASLPPHSLRVDDVVVLAPDALSRRLLQDRLLPRQRRSQGLQGRCAERLRREQAVFWDPGALGVILGPLAPLLQEFQEGCLVLELDPLGLRWQGEAASVEGVLLPLPSRAPLSDVPLQPPLPADRLLELEGDALAPLLRGLLSRQLIREPLSRTYRLDARRQELLRQAPFRLRLRPLPQGPFQAALELQLELGSERQAWQALLRDLATSLRAQQLRGVAPAPAAPLPAAAPAAPLPPGDPLRAIDWQRQDGQLVGGWRWLQAPDGRAQVLFFLGPPPVAPRPMGEETLRPAAGELRLRARPAALEAVGLLPPDLPPLLRRSEQLWVEAVPPPGVSASQPLSRLTGRLQVRR
ncbi:MAG: hypothetical protein VKJ05_02355 [Synechococcaceae cyanobacterium]|nr:hypothetical protein [Synechococcaceae cyanobacterium]